MTTPTLPERIRKLMDQDIDLTPLKGFSHPCRSTCSGWEQGFDRGRAYQHDKTQKLMEAMAECLNEFKQIHAEIHDEHCDEDWHRNWCESLLIASTKLERVVEEMESGG